MRTERSLDTSSPSLARPQASGRYDGWLPDSIPPYSPQTVEPEPHIPSYLYMASKLECVSLSIEISLVCVDRARPGGKRNSETAHIRARCSPFRKLNAHKDSHR